MCNAPLLVSVYDSITPDLTQSAFQWLPIQQRKKFKVFLVYKAQQQLPSFTSYSFQLQPTCRQLRSSSSSPHFNVPRTRRVSFADRSLSFFGSKEWSTLPNHIKDAQTVDIFKKLLKPYLFGNEVYCN